MIVEQRLSGAYRFLAAGAQIIRRPVRVPGSPLDCQGLKRDVWWSSKDHHGFRRSANRLYGTPSRRLEVYGSREVAVGFAGTHDGRDKVIAGSVRVYGSRKVAVGSVGICSSRTKVAAGFFFV